MDLKITGNVIIKHKKVPECEWCDKAKELLDEKEIPYTLIESDKKLFGEAKWYSAASSKSGDLIGGYKGKYIIDIPESFKKIKK